MPMIHETLEDIAREVYQPIQDVANEIRERDRKRARAYIGGGLIFAISMLAMKCDNTRTYADTLDKIQQNRQAVQHVQDNGFYIGEPCFYGSEVEAC